VPLAVGREELRSAGGRDRNRSRVRLRLPVEQRVPKTEVDDLLRRELAHLALLSRARKSILRDACRADRGIYSVGTTPWPISSPFRPAVRRGGRRTDG